MFKRDITETLKKTVKTFPITVLTGPRQSGKTTLLKQLFPDYEYVNLEAPDTLFNIQTDPRGFLQTNADKWIIDEAQNYPELFSYIQEYVDEVNKAGMFILSGSQNFQLAEKINQSLAGRAAILELLPLCYQEYLTSKKAKKLKLWEYLYYGTYPRPYHEQLDINIWFSSYIRTYLERDVRKIINVQNLSKFQLFLRLCAGRHGQLLNLSSLAQDCGISQTTVTHWLSILQASYIVFLLQPHYRNFKKRLVKTPKLYFYDSAIVCLLLGIESPQHLAIHSSRGAIFEGFILAEIIKFYTNQAKVAPLYFWRDYSGIEIDGLIEQGEQLKALEIKSSMTITNDLFRGLYNWQKISNFPPKNCYLIYAGQKSYEQKGIHILSWTDLDKVNKTITQSPSQE